MSLKDLLGRHKSHYDQDPESAEKLLDEISQKSHETNSYLLKKFSSMSLLAILFFLCESTKLSAIKLFGIELAYSPILTLVISAVYSYNLMLWSFTTLDDLFITYLLHKKRDITGRFEDVHLLHFQKFPLSIFCTENIVQAHFQEVKYLNAISWKLNKWLATLTTALVYFLGFYLPITSIMKMSSFSILYLFLIAAITVQLAASVINIARALIIQRQWD